MPRYEDDDFDDLEGSPSKRDRIGKSRRDDGYGHNSGGEALDSSASDALQSYVRRVENLEEKKGEIADDIKLVYAEAKSMGFDTKTIRRIIALRKKDASEREQEQQMLDLYLAAMGM